MDQALFMLAAFLAGPLAVETTGYFWHRFVEHHGIFGNFIKNYHIKHHEKDYPTTKLRPESEKYRSARSIGWYLLTVVLIVGTYLLVPRPYNFVMMISGAVYAKFVLNYLHSRFHVANHWLTSRSYFQKIQRLHDIHHYGPYNYGILFYFMDRLCGTYRETFPSKKQSNF